MRQKLTTIGSAIQHHLQPAEADINAAIASNAELIACIARERAGAGIAVSLGHDVVQALIDAQVALVASATATISAHGRLTEMRDRYGLKVTGTGGATWKGDENSIYMPMGSLSVVHDTDQLAA